MNMNLPETKDSSSLILPRKTAFWAGLFYVLTFVSIPTLFLYLPLHDPNYLLSAANDNQVVLGGILEIVVALCGIVTSIILFSVLKHQNESLAIGLIASRIVEAGTMFAGVAFLLGASSLHQQGADASSTPIAQTLVAMYDRIFVLGQGFMPGINDILLGLLLYQSRLVPRGLALLGIVGAFPLFAGYIATMFGIIERTSPLAGASAVMVAIFEFSLGIYLLVKGLKKSKRGLEK
ncbi:MAG: DUF4386 domain-containing protein [Saprospiraceae bacterium]|nr:DUF4386 domain-containing protein [Saprospiraceae bacterium]